MSEAMRKSFWAGLLAFQVVFGLGVFAATRHYYLNAGGSRSPGAGQAATVSAFPPSLQESIASLPATSLAGSDPVAPEEIARQADAHFQAREYAAAAVLYDQLLEMDPSNVDLHNNIGITLHYLGRTAEAIDRLNQGLAIDPDHQRSWLTLGFINAQIGDAEAAATALMNAVRIDPDNDIGQSAASMLRDLGIDLPVE